MKIEFLHKVPRLSRGLRGAMLLPFLFLCVLAAHGASIEGAAYAFQQSQSITVKGKITDENGDPIPGAVVLEKGTTNGSAADVDGNYAITVSGSNAVLVFSSIGYTKTEVEVGNRSVIDFSMQPDIQQL